MALFSDMMDEASALRSENRRLRAGIKEIDRFLTENRIGDALFVCDALLTGGDEQLPVSLATVRQPEERAKNERMRAAMDAVGQLEEKK